MRNRPGLFAVLLATLLTTSFVGLVEAADQNLPVPTVVVPTLSQPPVIDGTLEAGEWHDAAAVTGFVTAFKNQLSPYQSVARVARHEGYIYVALVNQRSRFDTLLKKTARQPDDTRIVSDHANEIWMTPPLEPPTTYQTLFNAYPAVFDARIMPTVGNTSKSWSADWEIAGSEDREHWYIEARAPLDSFGGAEVSDDTIWRGLFTTDVIGRRTGGFRAWAPGGAFADIDRHGFLHFKDGAPAAQWLDATRLRTDDYRLPFAFTGGEENAVIDLVVRIGGNVEATPQDHIVKRSLTVGPGERKQVVIEGSFDDIDLPTGRFPLVLDPSQRETFRHGFAEITATRRDGLVLYQQLVPFVIDNFVVEGPEEIVRNPYDASIGVNATLAPLSRQLLVQVDRLYMDEPTRVAGGTAALTDAETGEVLATRKIAPFRHDDSDFAIDLADVEMPVETEADWLQQQAAKKAGEQAPGVKPRPLRLKVDLVNAEGAPLATAEQAVEAMTYEFEWLGNRIGMSDEVIPPWEPVVVDGKTVSMWNKTYDVNALGLADRIVNSEAPQLSGPMRLEAVIDGETLHIEPGDLEAGKSVPVRAEWRGETRTDRLAIDVDSAVEFDGAVFNTMRIQPAQNVSLKRLSLVVEMPEREGELMVTTSGGWNAFHGWTPRKWDSRQTSSGSVAGSFVPYVLLTDSERGFQVFADNDKGWRVDPDLPTHEVVRENGKTKLRVNFVHRAKEGLSEPTTVEYGWITTPQKPQPANWRGYELWTYSTYPEATAMFWTDADWALVYPYFTSPFPWDYEKSKELLQQRKDRGTIPAVGNIAHAIGRYQDYKGRTFLPVAGDWAPVPGQRTGRGDVARSRGATDFQVWHYDKWIRDSDLVALYFDEPYLHEDRNFLTGGAYLTEDERIQPGYSYLDLREYFLRLRYLFHSHGLDRPNLWIHTTAGQPVYSWFPDLSMAGENVAPMGGSNDYLEALPAGRLRSVSMGRNFGAAAVQMLQADRHWKEDSSLHLSNQFIGWVMAHDVLPSELIAWSRLAAELKIWRESVEFLPYWKQATIRTATEGIIVSAHTQPTETVLWVVNETWEDRQAALDVDLSRLGLDAEGLRVFDAETGEPITMSPRGEMQLPVPARMWRAVRLVQPAGLDKGQTFVASFDETGLTADYAIGGPSPMTPIPADYEEVERVGDETGGKAIAPGARTAIMWSARHHAFPAGGEIKLRFQPQAEQASGTLLRIDDLRITLGGDGTLVLEQHERGRQWNRLDATEPSQVTAGQWHRLEAKWQPGSTTIAVDGKVVLRADFSPTLAVSERGLAIQHKRINRAGPPPVGFGPTRSLAIDDLAIRSEYGTEDE